MLSQQDTKTWPLSAAIETFLADRHIATLTTLRPDGTPHVVPVSFSWDSEARLVRIMTGVESRKVRNLTAAPGGRVAVCQADGRAWVTLEGTATVFEDPELVAEGRRRYIERYRRPRGQQGNGTRPMGNGQAQRPRIDPLETWQAVIEIAVDRVMSRNL